MKDFLCHLLQAIEHDDLIDDICIALAVFLGLVTITCGLLVILNLPWTSCPLAGLIIDLSFFIPIVATFLVRKYYDDGE